MTFENITFQLPVDELGNLEFLAGLISPELSSPDSQQLLPSLECPSSSGYNSTCSSADYYSSNTSSSNSSTSGSPGLAPPTIEGFYHYPSPTPYSPYPVYAPPTSQQFFFPENFSPNQPASFDPQAFQLSVNSYLQSVEIPSQNAPHLRMEKSKLKNRRASRSKCPCFKCCHARAHQIPSPTYHACIVKSCQKTYTRPAHLRNHLKSHDNDGRLQCDICSVNFISSDLLISHMFEHGQEMKN